MADLFIVGDRATDLNKITGNKWIIEVSKLLKFVRKDQMSEEERPDETSRGRLMFFRNNLEAWRNWMAEIDFRKN